MAMRTTKLIVLREYDTEGLQTLDSECCEENTALSSRFAPAKRATVRPAPKTGSMHAAPFLLDRQGTAVCVCANTN